MFKAFHIFPPPVPWLRAQRTRRVLVGLSVALLVAVLVLALSKLGVAAALCLGLAYALVVLLQFATRNLTNTTDSSADERERKLRDHAHRVAYWSWSLPIGVLVGLLLSRSMHLKSGEPLLQIDQFGVLEFQVLVVLVGVIFAALPSYVVAWLEPDSAAE
jgi:Ca2+/Na+ antiporter